jgi:aerobic carbon-monoxide dehydrogenase medium subunit
MIPGSFDYHRPKSVAEAVNLLTKTENSRVIAGGHSLLPMMKLRMAEPSALVDLAGIDALKGIKEAEGKITIGAMTTQHELLASKLIARALPLLHEAALLIADPQVRYMGTIGGNVANGDPGNDMPAVMMALDATYKIAGNKERSVKARDFYMGSYQTALEAGEIVTAIEIPTPGKTGYAYEKLKRKVGDYATAAAAVVLTMTSGKIATCTITLTNLAPTPLMADAAAEALVGTTGDDAALAAAVAAARKIMNPANDTRGTPQYRTSVGGTYVARAVKSAMARA